MRPEIVVGSLQDLTESCARELEEAAARAVEEHGRFAVALPGGSVATAFFPRLAHARVDSSRTDFFWVDERAVPLSDPESNYGVAERLWLKPRRIAPDRVHRMPADASDLERAAASYSDELSLLLGDPPRLDVALIGVGPDGHVASLFPGHRILRGEERWVAAILDSPKPPKHRLTLTLPVLRAANLLIVAAMGETKAEVVRRAIEEEASELPLSLALRGTRRALFLLDSKAACRLSRS